VFSSRLKFLVLLVLCLLIAFPAHAKTHETGFLDRSITVQGTTYKYQVFVPDTWTPHEKWPVILFLHGAGERGEDGLQETDVGIGTAIRSNRSTIPAIVVMPQCRPNVWWMQAPMDDLAIAALNAAIKEFHGDVRLLDRTFHGRLRQLVSGGKISGPFRSARGDLRRDPPAGNGAEG
jgi:hypothetical protein